MNRLQLETLSSRRVALVATFTFLMAVLATVPSRGATILIDDFSTEQSIVATAGSPIAYSTATAPEAIGGERDFYAEVTSGPTAITLSSNPFGGELLIHDSGTSVTGATQTTWDGPDGDATSTDYTGLGGVDLLQGGALDAFKMTFLLADLTGAITIRVWDAADATGETWSEGTLSLPGAIFSPIDVTLPYSAFTTTGAGGAANFGNVGAIRLEISNEDTGSLDLLMSKVEAVPEPTGWLLGLLGGLLVFRRSRNA